MEHRCQTSACLQVCISVGVLLMISNTIDISNTINIIIIIIIIIYYLYYNSAFTSARAGTWGGGAFRVPRSYAPFAKLESGSHGFVLSLTDPERGVPKGAQGGPVPSVTVSFWFRPKLRMARHELQVCRFARWLMKSGSQSELLGKTNIFPAEV